MPDFLRSLVRKQVDFSRRFDRRFFALMSVDGNGCFLKELPDLIADGTAIADVGGGKTPFFSVDRVQAKKLSVTGVDIDASELARAPAGAYDRTVVSPLEEVNGPDIHDVVIAQSVLEHVRDGRESIRGCASLLRAHGRLYTFCPNRRAWFARLNLILPEALKRRLLFSLFPEKRERQGFPANYDGCTPAEMRAAMTAAGLKVQSVRYFFVSSYFMFFFPLYLFWRLTTYPLMKGWPERYCETFMIVAEKGAE